MAGPGGAAGARAGRKRPAATSPPRAFPTAAILGLLLASAWASGCARQAAPTGGEMQDVDPMVVATEPDTFAVVEPFTDPVGFHFNKPMSEMPADGQLDDAVVVSPRTGEVSVDHRRRGFDVSLEGGWRGGLVYTVTLTNAVRDRWNMSPEEPFELHFSTGGAFHPTLLAGIVFDRLSGAEVAEARVDVRPLDVEEGPVYTTFSDEDGMFSLRFVPPGRYRIVAYEDVTMSGEADFTDPQDSLDVELAADTDTVVTEDLALLLPDTLPASLATAEAEDSITVRLDFDRHLDPEAPLDGVEAELRRQDEEEAPGIERILQVHQYEALLAEEEEAAEEEVEAEPDPAPAQEEPVDPLPAEALYLRLEGPLEPDEGYEVEVDGVVSVNGVPGGGGEAAFVGPEPPEEDPEDDPGDDTGEDHGEEGRPAGNARGAAGSPTPPGLIGGAGAQ